MIGTSCEKDQAHESDWFTYSISGYLEANKEEYSKFYMLLNDGNLANTLYAYNPYGEGYTLFLPTDAAIDHFIQQQPYIASFEELMLDTGFISEFCRYHVLNEKVHTGDFPFGALNTLTFTGDRLVIHYYEGEQSPVIKVNDIAPVVESNLELTNGYIHVISEALQKVEMTGYDWLQEQADYSILAGAMKLCGIKDRIWWSNYTILVEHDSVYNREGIYTVEDLFNRIGDPDTPATDDANPFYQFAALHILRDAFYLNDLYWGNYEYRTLAEERLGITTGVEIKINPGADNYGVDVSPEGDTTVIDYIRIVWEDCNILTSSGPIHTITDLLSADPFPGEVSGPAPYQFDAPRQ